MDGLMGGKESGELLGAEWEEWVLVSGVGKELTQEYLLFSMGSRHGVSQPLHSRVLCSCQELHFWLNSHTLQVAEGGGVPCVASVRTCFQRPEPV